MKNRLQGPYNVLTSNCISALNWLKYNLNQGVQGLQAFSFCVPNVTDGQLNLGYKESFEVKFKDGKCTKFCLK